MTLGTVPALVIVLLFILPGTVYQIVRTNIRGPLPQEAEQTGRLLRALTASTLLVGIYTIVAAPTLMRLVRSNRSDPYGGVLAHARAVAIWGMVLLVFVPAATAYIEGRIIRRHRGHARYDPTPNAWQWGTARAFNRPGFVRVLTESGTWVGGYYADQSHATTYPEPPSLFIERGHYMNSEGEFGAAKPHSRGTWVRCDTAVVVDFLDGVAILPKEGGEKDGERKRSHSASRSLRRGAWFHSAVQIRRKGTDADRSGT